jgi:CRISPR-associated endonuclease/helicase Cas3
MVLYAKGEPYWTPLDTHIEDCLQVFASLRQAFPYLPELTGKSGFWEDLLIALLVHDLGKAASGFQESLKGKSWNYRHEILSAGFALNLNLPDEAKQAIALAVVTHHHGYRYLWNSYRTTTKSGREAWIKNVAELSQNQDELIRIIGRFPQLAQKYFGRRIPALDQAICIERCQNALEACIRPLYAGEAHLSNRNYHILLRGLTIACDHLSSAGLTRVRELHRLDVYAKACDKIQKNGLLSFQEKVWRAYGSCMLQAPSAAGKTAAALLWSSGNQDAGRRIFYVLPYVASINAMQREFHNEYHIPLDDIGILHHRALYFIYKSFLEDETQALEAKKKAQSVHDQTRKIYRPVKILTPYQLIKPFYGIKGFDAQIAEVAGGLLIFDEIHAYEPHMVGLIVRLVEELSRLGCKCLFMSATLPTFLRDLLSRTHALGLPLISLDMSEARERALMLQTRHIPIHVNGEITEHLDSIREELETIDQTPFSKRKVLVVCNSVERAQTVYNSLRQYATSPKLIHSRFIASDRERIEREIRDADLLVGTQAIEVSLNFSFPVLYSEPAPIDALLQRMGRLNRFSESPKPAPAYIFTDGSKADEYIYDQDRVRRSLELLPDGRPLSNMEAASLVEELYRDGYSAEERSDYGEAYDSFSDVIAQLPLYDESDFKDEFFDLIKSVEAVPKKYYRQHTELLREERYLDAVGFVLPISSHQWNHLKREGRVWKEEGHWYVDAKYDPKLGLDLKESAESENIF